MNHEDTQQRLREQSRPTVPATSPPELANLYERVGLRRRRRRFVRGGVGCAALCALAAVTLSWLDREPVGPEMAPAQIAQTPSVDGALQEDSAPSLVPASSEQQPRIRLYATVRQPLPVFDIDQDTKAIHHVGWVEAEQSVPVDMRYVPDNQQETFNAVLRGDGWRVDL